jgi:hypothetical protein
MTKELHPHQLTSFADTCKFIFAGKARFTIVSSATQTRFTYQVTRKESEFKGKVSVIYFVKVMTGTDNESSYTYLGFFREGQGYVHGVKSPISADAPSAKAFSWFMRGMLSQQGQEVFSKIEFWHAGMCGRCGRTLTVPGSIEMGIGPECAGLMGMKVNKQPMMAELV